MDEHNARMKAASAADAEGGQHSWMATGVYAGASGVQNLFANALSTVEDDSKWHPVLRRLRLGHKFTALLVLTFLVGTGVGFVVLHQALQGRAEAEIAAQSDLLSGFGDSIRTYTNAELTPLLLPDVSDKQNMVMETVPTFVTKQVFSLIQSDPRFRDFEYKPAALNPTNRDDLADSEEASLVKRFHDDPSLSKITGYRELNGESVFYSARPLRVSDEGCLTCHGTPDQAPAALLTKFGRTNGFGWKLGETVAAEVVYVPATDIEAATNRATVVVMGVFVGIFAFVILLINVLLRRLVVWPVHRMSNLAAYVSQGEMRSDAATSAVDLLDSVARRGDELGQSARALQQMAREVYAREQRLKQEVQQLRIEIDSAKREREVQAITETDFFQGLQEKASRMRRRPSGSSD